MSSLGRLGTIETIDCSLNVSSITYSTIMAMQLMTQVEQKRKRKKYPNAHIYQKFSMPFTDRL
jgi:hypothetical protein